MNAFGQISKASPMVSDYLPARFKMALEYWLRLKGERALPLRKDFDPIEVPSILPHVAFVEVTYGGDQNRPHDFIFKIIGNHINDRAQANYTKQRFSNIPGKGPASGIWHAYQTTATSKDVHHSRIGYVGHDQFITGTQEIHLPFSGLYEDRVDYILSVVEFLQTQHSDGEANLPI